MTDARISIAIDSRPSEMGARRVKRSMRDVESSTGKATDSAKTFGTASKAAFATAAVAIGGVTTALGAALSAFASYEKALIGVGKTADISGPQLRGLGESVKLIAREVPVATNELLGLAQAAGQLGVKGTDNILAFTKTVGQLGLASNLAGEQAATSLARILTVTGTAIGDVDRLGSTVVRLGNNFAATESEIAQATTRIAQATSQFGATADEVTGIGAALTAVGVQAEAGGTVIGRAFQSINDVVRRGGEELESFTQITGKTADELRTLFQESPTAAFQSFVEGLGRINERGGDVTAALEGVGLEGVRVVQVLGTLATRSDVLSDALSQASDEWEKNTALTREAETAARSLSSQFDFMMESITGVGTAIGEEMGPTAISTLQSLTSVFNSIADNLGTVADYAKVAATALGTLLVVNRVSAAFSAAAASGAGFNLFLTAMSAGSATATVRVLALTAATRAFSAALRLVGGPVGLVVTVLATATTAFFSFRDATDEARDSMNETATSASTVSDEIKSIANEAERAALNLAEMNKQNAQTRISAAQVQLENAETPEAAIEAQRRLVQAQNDAKNSGLELANAQKRIRDRAQEVADTIDESSGGLSKEHKELVAEIEREIKQNERLATAMGVSRKEYNLVNEQLNILADEGFEGTAKSARELARRMMESKSTLLTASLEDEIRANERLADAARTSSREYEIVNRQLDIMAQGYAGTSEQARKLAENLVISEEQINKSQEAAREYERIWEQAAENIQDALGDNFRDMLDGNLKSTESFGESLVSMLKDFAAQAAAAMVFRPVIAPIMGGIQGALGGPVTMGGGGFSVPGFGGGMIGTQSTAAGGGGLGGLGDLGGLSNIGYSSTLAGAGRWFSTSQIGQSLGLSQALPRGGTIGLTGAGGSFSQALGYSPWGAIGSLAGSAMGLGSGNALIDTGLSTVGSIGGAYLGTTVGASLGGAAAGAGSGIAAGAAAGSWAGPIGAAIGALAGMALGSAFAGTPSEGQTMEAVFGRSGRTTAVGVDNNADRDMAEKMAQGFESALSQITNITGGRFSGGAYISNSARSGLRLDQGGSWLQFEDEAELVNYLVDKRLTGGDSQLRRAARRSNASSVEDLLSDLQMAQQIQGVISSANDNMTPLEQAIENVNEQFSDLISNASRLGFSTSELVRIRNEEIQAIREQERQQKEMERLNVEQQVLNRFGQAGAQISSFISGYRLSGGSSLNPTQRLSLAEQEFETLLSSVEGGNLGAIGALNQSASTYLGFAREQFASSSGFTDIESRVLGALQGVRGDILSEQNINDTIQSELELTRLSQEEASERVVDAIREEIGSLRQEITQLRIRSEAA